MKTSVLFASALFFASALSAQEIKTSGQQATQSTLNAGSEASAMTNSSSSAKIEANTGNKVRKSGEKVKKEVKHQVSSAKETVKENSEMPADVSSSERFSAGNNNKTGGDASIRNENSLSLAKGGTRIKTGTTMNNHVKAKPMSTHVKVASGLGLGIK